MIRIGIVGYGNLGKSCESLIKRSDDMELFGIFTRRDLKEDKFYLLDDINDYKDDIDVLILCGSSDKDILIQAPKLIENFNTVDSFDTHKKIYDYYKKMDKLAKDNKKTALISTGWDPGLFSLIRTYAESVLEDGNTYTFWGKGISQGHSAAVRSIDGIADASQYTIPKEDYIEKVKNGENLEFKAEDAHVREVFAVAKEGYDLKELEKEIKSIPNYFDKYETSVHFISQDELNRNHKGMPHGGRVIRSGKSANNNLSTIEFRLDLDSNPDFTAAVDLAYARAIYRFNKEEKYGAYTVLDIAPKYLSKKDYDKLLKENI
ncbi:diaminopimelate dehydrogenase [Anaerococcus sp. AGMB00486]|uniref:Meso-diaminopimelate D-dehydrogenase n=1 Tax=Anaerococcus faecalis TaxID=2742993 RepID=A0ABX2N8G9_9FIRM|nr:MULTISPECIES: diaminopimelate dehydrogenase [Anaerococcus]MDY3006236.1 diaminopimelate dehydrogenase [Anaerococcus porci]NVF10987.1 diaminopimelate dehydrogenase [Anaerococcus faecalis]